MRHLLCLLPFALAAFPAQAQMVTITPEQIGEIFCIGSMGNDMSPVETQLSPELRTAINEAWAANAAYEAAHPGEKPPLGDGLPWRTYPDYADGCTIAGSTVEGDTASVTVDYTFTEWPDAAYSNELLLVRQSYADGGVVFWRLDDVRLADDLTMRESLQLSFVD